MNTDWTIINKDITEMLSKKLDSINNKLSLMNDKINSLEKTIIEHHTEYNQNKDIYIKILDKLSTNTDEIKPLLTELTEFKEFKETTTQNIPEVSTINLDPDSDDEPDFVNNTGQNDIFFVAQ